MLKTSEKGVIRFMEIIKKHSCSAFNLYIFLILAAFEILMSFTFLGYVHIVPISVTFAYIPILIAACVLGTAEATAVGVIFGAASMYKSTSGYTLAADKLFSPLLSGNPVGSVVLSIGARALFGLAAGIILKAAMRRRHSKTWVGVVSALSPQIHAFFVLLAMKMFFPENILGYLKIPYLIVSNIISSVLCMIIMEIILKLKNNAFFGELKTAVDNSGSISYIGSGKKNKFIAAFMIFAFGMTVAAALYFSNRMSYMLNMHDVHVSEEISGDLMHLQTQFMAAMLSLNIISVVILILGYQYTSYKNFLGELDAVTGVMGRRIFLNCCERAQKRLDSENLRRGWFLFLDVDYFKSINDTLGHSVGDDVLREVALTLKELFADFGIAGRMGGDEFAVMIDKKELSERELCDMLDIFLLRIENISERHKVSCSIGVCRFDFPADMTRLMDKTDELLYRAKENGRACYVIGEYDGE